MKFAKSVIFQVYIFCQIRDSNERLHVVVITNSQIHITKFELEDSAQVQILLAV